jgi:signal transduction histidine kinase
VLFRELSERLAADRMKSEFVSVVSHELRTPLTAIRGSLGLVSSGKMGALPPAVEKMVAMAMRNVDRLALLIDDILSLEAMESGTVCLEIQDCPARDLLERALEDNRPLAERASIPLELRRAEGTVRADPHRIQQVLTNLVGNAVKFSPAGAPIVLAAIPVEADREVRFEVRDHGRGIPADQVQHVFERFRQVDSSDTREKGGTGLGLAICRNLVRAHNGRIWVESVEGRGSTFLFTLPMADAQEQD